MNPLTISPALKRMLNLGAAAYLLYALFLLIESLDFLDMLHSKPPDFHPTYTLVNVVYYIVDMIICLALGFGSVLLTYQSRLGRLLTMLILFFLFRAGTIYYLYFYETPSYRWVPYIYKVANEFSKTARGLFLPAQLFFGITAIWITVKLLKKKPTTEERLS